MSFQKYVKLKPHIEYYIQAYTPLLRHGYWSVMLKSVGIKIRVTKIIKKKKKVKDDSHKEGLEKL